MRKLQWLSLALSLFLRLSFLALSLPLFLSLPRIVSPRADPICVVVHERAIGFSYSASSIPKGSHSIKKKKRKKRRQSIRVRYQPWRIGIAILYRAINLKRNHSAQELFIRHTRGRTAASRQPLPCRFHDAVARFKGLRFRDENGGREYAASDADRRRARSITTATKQVEAKRSDLRCVARRSPERGDREMKKSR